MKISYRYLPRADFVLFRLVDRGELRGLLMPGISQQGKERIVVAVGPDVVGLKEGDRIYVIGSIGLDVVALPNETDLLLTKSSNVIVTIETVEE